MIIDFGNKGGNTPVSGGTPLNKTLTANGTYTYNSTLYKPVTINVDVQAECDMQIANVARFCNIKDTLDSRYVSEIYEGGLKNAQVSLVKNLNTVEYEGSSYTYFEWNGRSEYFDCPSGIQWIKSNGEWLSFDEHWEDFNVGGHYVFPEGTAFLTDEYGFAIQCTNTLLNDGTTYGDVENIVERQEEFNPEEGTITYYYKINNNASDGGEMIMYCNSDVVYNYFSGTLYTIPDHTKFYVLLYIENTYRSNKVNFIDYNNNKKDNLIKALSGRLFYGNDMTPINYNSSGLLGNFIYQPIKTVPWLDMFLTEFEVKGGEYLIDYSDDNFLFINIGGDTTMYTDYTSTMARYEGELDGYHLKEYEFVFDRKQSGFRIWNNENAILFNAECSDWAVEIRLSDEEEDRYCYIFDDQRWEEDKIPPTSGEVYKNMHIDGNGRLLVTLKEGTYGSQTGGNAYVKIK